MQRTPRYGQRAEVSHARRHARAIDGREKEAKAGELHRASEGDRVQEEGYGEVMRGLAGGGDRAEVRLGEIVEDCSQHIVVQGEERPARPAGLGREVRRGAARPYK